MNIHFCYAALLAGLLSNYASAQDDRMGDPLSTDTPSAEIRKSKTFCATQKDAACEHINATDEVGLLGDLRYRLFIDSASVATEPGIDINDYKQPRWSVGCNRDKMTGTKTCSVSRGALWVFFRSAGPSIVSVGDEHFPGSVSSIKVGAKRFDTRHQDGIFSNSQQIIRALSDGQPVVTRFMKWPYREWEDDEFNATGFQAASRLANWLLKNGKIK